MPPRPPLRLNSSHRIAMHARISLTITIIRLVLLIRRQPKTLDMSRGHSDGYDWLIWVDGLREELGGEGELAQDLVLVLLGRGRVIRHDCDRFAT